MFYCVCVILHCITLQMSVSVCVPVIFLYNWEWPNRRACSAFAVSFELFTVSKTFSTAQRSCVCVLTSGVAIVERQ